jgi:predicted O-methyltransferase YrrM
MRGKHLMSLLASRGSHTADRVGSALRADGPGDHYRGVLVGAATVGERASSGAMLDDAIAVAQRLDPDDYTRYVRTFVEAGRERAGAGWRYADVLTALGAACDLIRPRSYLEVGVRRGRSMAMVAAKAPECDLIGVDLWQEGYGGAENPGPELVRSELAKFGHRGKLELLSGDSHELLPRLFAERPELTFDLVTVDGDHTVLGASRDLRDVLPRLRVGGALVFDDISHPAHPRLREVWRANVAASRRYATWEFADVGYGVAVAVRRW